MLKMFSLYTVVFTLFLAIDAFGLIPEYFELVRKYSPKKQFWISVRELFFALIIMVLFHYLGKVLFSLLELSITTINVAGGIILFLIAIRLIFPDEDKKISWATGHPPFIVPVATPLIAGPSVLAVIMIYSQEIQSDIHMLWAIVLAWLFSVCIFLLANPLYKYLGPKVLIAIQKLMGLLFSLIAVQMFLQGIKLLIAK